MAMLNSQMVMVLLVFLVESDIDLHFHRMPFDKTYKNIQHLTADLSASHVQLDR